MIKSGSFFAFLILLAAVTPVRSQDDAIQGRAQQLANLLRRFPEADTNGDGKLSIKEAQALRNRQNRKRQPKPIIAPPPTHENVRYGPYRRNVLDLWLPEAEGHVPLIMFIHGGGFTGGNKESVRRTNNVQAALDRGVAFAAIHYRFRYQDNDFSDPERTGIQHILRDAARAIQYLRAHADRYHLNKRIACYGGSAGAGTSLWLAAHDDLADPTSADPVLRESSRISAAGMLAGQFTYDIAQWDIAFKSRGGDIVKTHGEGNGQQNFGRFFGLTEQQYNAAEGKKWRADVDMRGLITADDPPIFALTANADLPPTTRGIYNHHPHHAALIEATCIDNGVEVVCLLPKVRPQDQLRLQNNPDLMMEFFFKHLGVSTTAGPSP